MRGAQPRQPVLRVIALPGQKFLGRDAIARLRLGQAQQSAMHGDHHFGLAAGDPALEVFRWKIGSGQHIPIGADDVTAVFLVTHLGGS